MSPDWFENLLGFKELSYRQTQANLEVVDNTLRSRVNEQSYAIGVLETPSLAELRTRAAAVAPHVAGTFRVSSVVDDVGRLHSRRSNRHALFQVASQFNLLEMTGPDVIPENGVTRYVYDRTQGPACAIAAGAATVYRNYFAPVDGQVGQTEERQFDCLRDLGVALGNEHGELWTMRNGYALCTAPGLAAVHRQLATTDEAERDRLRGLLRIGLHWDVEVTDGQTAGGSVSQAFCSALPVAYTRIPTGHWTSFASLILDAAYEATLLAAVINAARTSSNVVFLTQLGGGAFGNESPWIHAAIRRALEKVTGIGLDVRLVSYGAPDPALRRLVDEYA
jgi:hypothetical protein